MLASLRLVLMLLSAGLPASASAQGAGCQAPLAPMQQVELLFGRNLRGRLGVTDQLWSRFLAEVITPRFPDGLTVLDGAGQWKSGARIAHERSKLVMILTPAAPDLHQRLEAIVAAYKLRFRQQAVGVVMRSVCAGFP